MFFFSIKRKGLAGSALVDICSLSLAKTSHVCGALSLNINRGTYKVNPVSVCYSYAINRFPDASSSLSDNKKVYRTYQVGDMLQRVREHIFFYLGTGSESGRPLNSRTVWYQGSRFTSNVSDTLMSL